MIMVIEHQKCGRTWLRIMLAKAWSILGDYEMDGFFRGSGMPEIANSHEENEEELRDMPEFMPVHHKIKMYKQHYCNILFVVREPKDVMVSWWNFRKDWPDKKMNLHQWIRDKTWGLERFLRWLKHWDEIFKLETIPIAMITYEDMKENTHYIFKSVLEWIQAVEDAPGLEITDDLVRECVDFASFERMKNMEKTNMYKTAGIFDGKKMRKGIVGDHVNAMSKSDIRWCDQLISSYLTDTVFERYVQ